MAWRTHFTDVRQTALKDWASTLPGQLSKWCATMRSTRLIKASKLLDTDDSLMSSTLLQLASSCLQLMTRISSRSAMSKSPRLISLKRSQLSRASRTRIRRAILRKKRRIKSKGRRLVMRAKEARRRALAGDWMSKRHLRTCNLSAPESMYPLLLWKSEAATEKLMLINASQKYNT